MYAHRMLLCTNNGCGFFFVPKKRRTRHGKSFELLWKCRVPGNVNVKRNQSRRVQAQAIGNWNAKKLVHFEVNRYLKMKKFLFFSPSQRMRITEQDRERSGNVLLEVKLRWNGSRTHSHLIHKESRKAGITEQEKMFEQDIFIEFFAQLEMGCVRNFLHASFLYISTAVQQRLFSSVCLFLSY